MKLDIANEKKESVNENFNINFKPLINLFSKKEKGKFITVFGKDKGNSL